MRSQRLASVGTTALLALLITPVAALGFSGGPPDGVTGAPGENTCTQCHSGGPGAGSVQLFGPPTTYDLNQVYLFTIQLDESTQDRWGFELTAVDQSGDGVGSFIITDPPNTQLSGGPAPARSYVKQTADGTYHGTVPPPVTWACEWMSPSQDMGPVDFYLAGNAADGNGSTSGDSIYTTSAQSGPPAPTGTPTMPAETPTPTPSPTMPMGTPTPTPTGGGCSTTGVVLEMPDTLFSQGENCYLDALVCNDEGQELVDYPLFVILDVAGDYWLAPGWGHVSEGLDFIDQDYPEGETRVSVIPSFPWPGGVGSGSSIIFWGALTDPAITNVVGVLGQWTFGWM